MREFHGKFTIRSIYFHVKFFQWGKTMQLEYAIKCRLFTRKWHVIQGSLVCQMEFDWWNTIQVHEKLSNVHVLQWLSMFWLDFGLCLHSTWWNLSCLACALWIKEWEICFNFKISMHTFCIPLNLDLHQWGSCTDLSNEPSISD